MLGPVGPEAMRLVMSAADLLMLPSLSEGIALVLFEALSMGVVPVSTEVGGQRELVTPDCGVLLPADERLAGAMVESIDALLRDGPLRDRLSDFARERGRRCGRPGRAQGGRPWRRRLEPAASRRRLAPASCVVLGGIAPAVAFGAAF